CSTAFVRKPAARLARWRCRSVAGVVGCRSSRRRWPARITASRPDQSEYDGLWVHLRARDWEHAALWTHPSASGVAAGRERVAATRRERIDRRNPHEPLACLSRRLAGFALAPPACRGRITDQKLPEFARDKSRLRSGAPDDVANQSAPDPLSRSRPTDPHP